MEEEQEIWKDVVGFEGLYQVSGLGRVKSLERRVKRIVKNRVTTSLIKERIFKKYLNGGGYQMVKLYYGNKKFKNSQVHRLVAQAFIPNPNNYLQINHINGNPADNNANNLEWCTGSQNTKHAYDTGLKDPKNYRGEANPCAITTEEVVKNIRKDYNNNLSLDELATKYKLRKNHIGLIIHYYIWKHV